MKIKLPIVQLPFTFNTRLGEAQIIVARGELAAPGIAIPAAAAFARMTEFQSTYHPVAISAIRGSYEQVFGFALNRLRTAVRYISRG